MAYQIKNTCLCCHYCALECPAGAIDYVGTHYAVDPDKCIDCGRCAEVCNVGAACPVDTEAVRTHEPLTIDCDIAVLGAGACGMVAAVRAAEQSEKKVVILEKADKPGGSAWFAFCGISIDLPPDPNAPPPPPGPAMLNPFGTPEIRAALDADVVETFDRAQGELGAWYQTLPGLRNELAVTSLFGRRVLGKPDGRYIDNLSSTDDSIGPGNGGSFLIRNMLSQLDRLGIELITGTAARRLLLDENGAVCGVEAEDAGGPVTVRCKAVICATGGYAWNDELLRRHVPWFFGDSSCEPAHRFAAPTNTGDIAALGTSAGAEVDVDSYFCNLFGPVHHPFSFYLYRACGLPEIVIVGLDGKRFFNEHIYTSGSEAMLQAPRREAWGIADKKNLDILFRGLAGPPVFADPAQCRKDLEDELRNGFPVRKADTLEELAEKCGIDKEAFLETIRRYNCFCAAGRDEDFGKTVGLSPIGDTGPYYAIYCKTATDGAFGGVRINGRGEVYKKGRGGVIPGLFAGGDNAAGWAVNMHREGDHRAMLTNEIQWAQVSGFIAGSEAAQYVQ